MSILISFTRIVLISGILLSLTACQTAPIRSASVNVSAGVPIHPAMYRYYYYPDVEVYFDIRRGSYFYFSNGSWRISATLPHTLRIKLGAYVNLELDTLEPYHYYRKHKQNYPRGYFKQKHRKHHEKEYKKKQRKDHYNEDGHDRDRGKGHKKNKGKGKGRKHRDDDDRYERRRY